MTGTDSVSACVSVCVWACGSAGSGVQMALEVFISRRVGICECNKKDIVK